MMQVYTLQLEFFVLLVFLDFIFFISVASHHVVGKRHL